MGPDDIGRNNAGFRSPQPISPVAGCAGNFRRRKGQRPLANGGHRGGSVCPNALAVELLASLLLPREIASPHGRQHASHSQPNRRLQMVSPHGDYPLRSSARKRSVSAISASEAVGLSFVHFALATLPTIRKVVWALGSEEVWPSRWTIPCILL